MSNGLRRGTKLSSRLLSLYSVIFLVMIGLMALVVDRVARDTLIDDIEDNLAVAAELSLAALPEQASDYQAWAEETFRIGGFRTTLIDTSGVVLADSHSDPAAMENHGTREEVEEAMTGQIGVAQRVSASTGFDQLYVALPPQDDLVVRTSIPVRVINDDVNALRWAIAIAGLILGVTGVVAVAYLARRMAKPIGELTEQAKAVAEGDLGVDPRRSPVTELDELGMAISTMAGRLGARVTDAEQATATLEVVLGALPQGTVLVGTDDLIIYANPAAQAMLGAVPDDVAGLSPHQFQTAIRDARDTGRTVRRDLEHGTPVRKLRGVATPFSDDARVLLLIIDITERERADSVRRDFVANASHELKTPVATIIASAEAMQIALARGDNSVEGFADRVEGSARQLDRLVNDLLDLSRLERDRPDMSPVRVDLLVLDEVERVRGVAGDKGLTIESDVSETIASVSHRDVAIAVRNLLDNAIRYSSDEGKVTVAVDIDDGAAQISVADTGEGIPIRDMERIFERFYRVDSARSRATGGTGLGLSIVKHVAESHGGSVAVDSELGVGSKFTIRLPIGEESSAN